ncbi:hypothetical protein GCM10027614_03040 [Micromonospora vulcania]
MSSRSPSRSIGPGRCSPIWRIAPCLPGAQLTGVDGDVYRGKVKVKVGPVISEFTGTAQFVERTTPRTTG